MENKDCFFYIAGDRDCPDICNHPANKQLDYLPCERCKFYITKEESYNVVVNYVESRKTFEDEYDCVWYGNKEDYKTFNQNEVSDFIKQELAKQNAPLRMNCIGYSSHDAESWYACPKCKAQYGAWSFINGRVTVTDGKFKCHECGTILYVPK